MTDLYVKEGRVHQASIPILTGLNQISLGKKRKRTNSNSIQTTGYTHHGILDGDAGISRVESEDICESSIEASKEIWNFFCNDLGLYGELETQTFQGIFNTMITEFFLLPFIQELKYARRLLDEVEPDVIFIESTNRKSLTGLAFLAVAEHYGIPYFDEPSAIVMAENRMISILDEIFLRRSLLKEFSIEDDSLVCSLERIAVFAPYVNWYKAVAPVLDRMDRKKTCIVTIYEGLPKLRDRCSKRFRSRSELEVSLHDVVHDVNGRYRARSEDESFRSIFQCDGVPFYAQIEPLLDFQFERGAEFLAFNSMAANMILGRIDPKILLIGTQPRSYAMGNIAAVAKTRGIKLIEIQHGIFSGIETCFFEPQFQDLILCGGEYWKNEYRRCGCKLETIEVVGWPMRDGMICSATEGKFTGKIVVATEPNYDFCNTLEELVRCSASTGIQILIKPHPFESKDRYSKFSRNQNVVILSSDSIESMISDIDILIIHQSTIGIEAIVRGKKLICSNLDGSTNAVIDWFVECGGACRVNNAIGLREAIENTYRGTNSNPDNAIREQFIKECLSSTDGNSSNRAKAAILSQLSSPD